MVDTLASYILGLKVIWIISVLFGNNDISLGSISNGYSMKKVNETGNYEAEDTSSF